MARGNKKSRVANRRKARAKLNRSKFFFKITAMARGNKKSRVANRIRKARAKLNRSKREKKVGVRSMSEHLDHKKAFPEGTNVRAPHVSLVPFNFRRRF